MTPTLEQEWVMACVSQERIRQDERWGEEHDPGDAVFLGVLMEEVGEVARALIDAWPDRPDMRQVREELIQVAASAVKWAEAIERRGRGGG